MKLLKTSLSLATILGALTVNVNAADSLADAFKNAKVKGQLKSYYISDNYSEGSTVDTDGFAVGGFLTYSTDSFAGFSTNFTFQTSHTLGLDRYPQTDKDKRVAFNDTLLSEAYLDYKFNKTIVRVGRSFIVTPLTASSGAMMIKDFFTGALLIDKSIQNTTLMFGAITDWTDRNANTTHFDSPIYMVYAKSKMDNLTLEVQGTFNDSKKAGTEDGTKDYYLEATYALPTSMPLSIGAQYIGFQTDEVNKKDSYMYGLKAELEVAGIDLGAYYNSTSDDNDVRGGWGTAKDPSYNDLYTINGTLKGTKSYQVSAAYDFTKSGIKGFKSMARYAQYVDYGVKGRDANSLDLDVKYNFSGALKGLEAQVIYAITSIDGTGTKLDDFNELRAKLNYKF